MTDDELCQRAFNAFATFEQSCKDAKDRGLRIYFHAEGNSFKEVFDGVTLEFSRRYSPEK